MDEDLRIVLSRVLFFLSKDKGENQENQTTWGVRERVPAESNISCWVLFFFFNAVSILSC